MISNGLSTMRSRSFRYLLWGMMVLLLSACAPLIKDFTPERGPVGIDVTIEGKRFGETSDDNEVKFGTATASDVQLLDPNHLVAEVPPTAQTGLISVTVGGRTGYSNRNFIVEGDTKWTFMVYIDGDNNLESAAIVDFLEMASVGSTAEVQIVVQMGRTPGFSSSHGNWETTRRFHIQANDTPADTPVQELGERNMGHPNELRDFVIWAVQNYPADHYALSIWDHGDGWRFVREKIARKIAFERSRGISAWGASRAVSWDDTDSDLLYMREVQQALEAAKSQIRDRSGTLVKLDVVGFDACLMGMIEVAYALRDVTNFVVASEDLEPNNGWPYDTILTDLVATPSFSARDLAGLIVSRYGDAYSSGTTQASVDIAELSDLCESIDFLVSKMNTEWANISAARTDTRQYHPTYLTTCWGVDLWDFADNLYNHASSAEMKTAALQVKSAVDDFVTNERHGSGMEGSYGIAIYFPPTQSVFNNDPDHTGYEESNTFMPVDFVNHHDWDNWLLTFYSNIPGGQ